MKKRCKIMIVVGEASGDSHAAKLASALKKESPQIDFEFFGATGKNLRKVGVETIVRADDFARVGIVEVATALPMFWKVFKKVKKIAIERKPDAVILVDFPDFNLRLAKAQKKTGLKIIYYVSPQVWAWKQFRVKNIKNNVDLLLTILPFEKDWYAKHNFNKVKYVGNPLAGAVKSKSTRSEFCEKHKLDGSKKIVSLLPGSRRSEIEKILPILIETACLMAKQDKTLQFVIPLASVRKISEVEVALASIEAKGLRPPEKLLTVKNITYEAINASDVAAVTSGTATLETAILGTPLAIVYKVSRLTYSVLRYFVSVENVGLVNLVANEKLAGELIQEDFTADSLSEELFRLLEDKENKKMRKKLLKIKDLLGKGGASKLAAEAILEELKTFNLTE